MAKKKKDFKIQKIYVIKYQSFDPVKAPLIDHYSSDFIFCLSVDYDTIYTQIYDLLNCFSSPSNWSPKTKRNIRQTIQLTPQIGFCCKTTYLSMKKTSLNTIYMTNNWQLYTTGVSRC
jgi:hypothetical protein